MTANDRAAENARKILNSFAIEPKRGNHVLLFADGDLLTIVGEQILDAIAAQLREAYDRGWLEGGWAAMERGFIEKDAEIARLQTMLGQAQADLMGCRDGTLVRDLRSDIRQAIQSSREHTNKLQEEIVCLRAELAKVKP